jgi:hypothetical protein
MGLRRKHRHLVTETCAKQKARSRDRAFLNSERLFRSLNGCKLPFAAILADKCPELDAFHRLVGIAFDDSAGIAIQHHVDADAAERSAYLKRSIAERRAQGADDADDIVVVGEEVGNETELNDERYQELKAREQTC